MNTTDAAERATATKWTWGDMWRDYVRRDGPIQSRWDPYVGKRGQGRPRLRWSDMFTKEMAPNFSTEIPPPTRLIWLPSFMYLPVGVLVLRCESCTSLIMFYLEPP
ncbi:hypothetical protein ANN_20539 [Periplaneta americana]|uniref:Uncharacterized protein n=1 Tax=Periplaneta americana TaxID=6978 RepID=A0ABQ8SE08_PERAM|nr:hypothetical protein ANN_20539 [Periplaneta americana]